MVVQSLSARAGLLAGPWTGDGRRIAVCGVIVAALHGLLAVIPESVSDGVRQEQLAPQRRSLEVRTIAMPARTEATEAVPTAAAPALRPVVHGVARRQTAASSEAPVSLEQMYLERSMLSVAPRALDPVVIDFPDFAGVAEHYVGEFEIYIDDTGGVVRVASNTSDLPQILHHAVQAAFLPARFAPGEVNGRPVRSRIRIEVTFGSTQPAS